MFIKKRLWQKLIKAGLKEKDGLTIARTEDDALIMHARHWLINADMKTVPKEYRAVIVEQVGDVPAKGEAWRAFAREEREDIDMNSAMGYWLMGKAGIFAHQYEATRFIAVGETIIRIIRCQEEEGGRRNTVGVSEEVIEGIDVHLIDREYETPPYEMMGIATRGEPGIAWYNNCGMLMVEPETLPIGDEGIVGSIRRVMDWMQDTTLTMTVSEAREAKEKGRDIE